MEVASQALEGIKTEKSLRKVHKFTHHTFATALSSISQGVLMLTEIHYSIMLYLINIDVLLAHIILLINT